MTDVERARECERHLDDAIRKLTDVRDDVALAGDAYPDEYADPVYRDVLNKLAVMRSYLEALRVPARAYRGEH